MYHGYYDCLNVYLSTDYPKLSSVCATFLNEEGLLQSPLQLEQGILLDLWCYNQLLSRYSSDKRIFCFLYKCNAFDSILNVSDKNSWVRYISISWLWIWLMNRLKNWWSLGLKIQAIRFHYLNGSHFGKILNLLNPLHIKRIVIRCFTDGISFLLN